MTQSPSAAAHPVTTTDPALKIELALFGVGRWGTHLLRNFLAHPHVKVRAVVEASPERLQAIAPELDDSVELLTDWQAAMALEGLTACAIATPATTHYKLIKTALQQNLHVLAEKPLTLDTASSQALCDLAKSQQRQLVIDHTYLFHSAVTTGKAAIASLGPLRYGYSARTHFGPIRRDVDALWDLAIHDISIFNHWLGERPTQVQAQGSSWLQPNIHTPLSPNGLADIVWCRLQYPSGFQATLHQAWNNHDKQRRLGIVGEAATLIFDEMNRSNLLTRHSGTVSEQQGWLIPSTVETTNIPVPPAEPLSKVCDHFVQCIETNAPSKLSSGEIGTGLVGVLVALSESMNQSGAWVSCDR